MDFVRAIRRKLGILSSPSTPATEKAVEAAVLVAYVHADDLEMVIGRMRWAYAQVAKRWKINDDFGSDPIFVVIEADTHRVVVMPPNGLFGSIRFSQTQDAYLAAQDAVKDMAEATFVFTFGNGTELALPSSIAMTGSREERRPALAIAQTIWMSGQPAGETGDLGTGVTPRPAAGLTSVSFGDTAIIHCLADDPEAAATGLREVTLPEVEREFGALLPLAAAPENAVVLNMADGVVWDMSGGIAVPLNKLAEQARDREFGNAG